MTLRDLPGMGSLLRRGWMGAPRRLGRVPGGGTREMAAVRAHLAHVAPGHVETTHRTRQRFRRNVARFSANVPTSFRPAVPEVSIGDGRS